MMFQGARLLRTAIHLGAALRYASITARLARRDKITSTSVTSTSSGAYIPSSSVPEAKAANLNVIQDGFGRQAPWFETDWNTRSKRSTREIMDWVIDVMITSNTPGEKGDCQGAVALDVATGTGIFARALAGAECASVVGIDATKEMLAHAERQSDATVVQPTYIQCDAASMPFEDNTFDLVTCRLAVHHFADPAVQLNEMVRVCKPGGVIAVVDLITVGDQDTDAAVKCIPGRGGSGGGSNKKAAAEHNRLEILRDPSHTRALSATELCELLSSSGLNLLQSKDGTGNVTATATAAGIQGSSTTAIPTLEVMMDLKAWMTSTNTPLHAQAEITAAMEVDLGLLMCQQTGGGTGSTEGNDAQENFASTTRTTTGMFPTKDNDGRILFAHTYAVVRGVKPHA